MVKPALFLADEVNLQAISTTIGLQPAVLTRRKISYAFLLSLPLTHWDRIISQININCPDSTYCHTLEPSYDITRVSTALCIVHDSYKRIKIEILQGWAKKWFLGCVNPASWLPLAARREFTQHRDHSFAHSCNNEPKLLMLCRSWRDNCSIKVFGAWTRVPFESASHEVLSMAWRRDIFAKFKWGAHTGID